jgi:glucose-6-phosphate 1-dehydrogenase
MVLFGVTGDLARRKIVPALYQLALAEALPEHFALVGFSRSVGEDGELRTRLREALEEHSHSLPVDEAVWEKFAARIHALTGSVEDPAAYGRLSKKLEQVAALHGTGGNNLFYFATPSSAFSAILSGLRESELVAPRRPTDSRPWSRVIIEKPLGRDLESFKQLNAVAHGALKEHQIFRIDHYLGKETVQNILVFRFGNAIFEPLWNRHHIDHVQITMAESIGVEGRGSFYEETGVMRDIVQNHLLQVLALCTMEPPVDFGPYEIRNMKSQVLRSLRVLRPEDVADSVVWGQYDGYRDEPGVRAESRTPTFVAIRATIDNWRWNGVPFYLRAGKGLGSRVTEISFHFRSVPACLFGDEDVCRSIQPNVLKIRIQPDEGISLQVASKIPGEGQGIGAVTMDFTYAEAFAKTPPEAYERLLLDAMRGDPTLFARRDEVEFSWQFVDPLLAAFEDQDLPLAIYSQGSQGPHEAAELLGRAGHHWVPID